MGSTIFPHEHIHKPTWISLDYTKQNQIDHICINKKFRSSMEDLRIKRESVMTSGHHLAVDNMKSQLKKN